MNAPVTAREGMCDSFMVSPGRVLPQNAGEHPAKVVEVDAFVVDRRGVGVVEAAVDEADERFSGHPDCRCVVSVVSVVVDERDAVAGFEDQAPLR